MKLTAVIYLIRETIETDSIFFCKTIFLSNPDLKLKLKNSCKKIINYMNVNVDVALPSI